MVFESIADLVPYGDFTVRVDKKNKIFGVFKRSQLVAKSKTKSRQRAIRKAIRLDKRSRNNPNWRKRR